MGSDESNFNVSVGSDGQSQRTVSTNHNLFEEKGKPNRYRTEVLPITSNTSLTARPNRLTHSSVITVPPSILHDQMEWPEWCWKVPNMSARHRRPLSLVRVDTKMTSTGSVTPQLCTFCPLGLQVTKSLRAEASEPVWPSGKALGW